jgi:hypothetical protein
LIWLVAIVLAQPSPSICGRWEFEDLRPCEIERADIDVLDAAGSVPAHQLAEGAIRFSSMPALGGDAYVLELRPDNRGGARASFTWLTGHPRWRWLKESRQTFRVSPTRFREFTSLVEEAMARALPDRGPQRDDEPERIFCTDGPGLLTERIHGGDILTMNGSCPYTMSEEHPNRAIEVGALSIICPRFRQEFNPRDGLGAACIRRDRHIRSAHR